MYPGLDIFLKNSGNIMKRYKYFVHTKYGKIKYKTQQESKGEKV